ncbi:apolipoprotein N-acyltransferase [Marinobacterium aestuariivivens]|uniref:Apolipoprotein N-acyltransferase n=1 Tax=Marinobacterium aestuariivivens TaxID=1698799 RepID=A0ABW1ZY24_9GAMM
MSATDRGSFSSWPFWLRALGALLAGGLTPLAFAPFDLWPLALLMPALFWFSLKRQSAARCGWLGWLFGLGFYGVGTSWVYVSIHTYGNASTLLAGLLTAAFVAGMALFSAAQGWMFGRLFGRTGARQWLGFVGLWVIWEWVRSWLLTGFPWLYLGYPLLDTPLAAWAPLGGVWLASLVALLLGVGSVQLLLTPQPPSRRNERILPAALISLVLLVPLLLQGAWTKPAGEPLRVGLVQGDIPQQLKWQRDLLPDILNRYMGLSMRLGDVDLLIWPETAIPAPWDAPNPISRPSCRRCPTTVPAL